MTAVHSLQSRWNNRLAQYNDATLALDADMAPMKQRVAAFDANRQPGFLRSLRRAFTKAVTITPLKRKIKKREAARDAEARNLRAAARDIFRQMGESALTEMPNGKTFQADYASLNDTYKELAATKSVVHRAIEEADDASDWEMLDMASNNKGISMLSYFETDDAKDAIKAAAKSIDNIRHRLSETPLVSDDAARSLGVDNDFGLVLDMLGGIGGTLMSYSNMRDLDNAAEKLRGVSDKISAAQQEIDTARDNILGVAVSVARPQAPELDRLATALAPWLTEKTAAAMTPRPPKFNL